MDCSIEMQGNNNKTILFNFIDNIDIKDNNEVVIEFTKAYTYFLASTNLIDYSAKNLERDHFCRLLFLLPKSMFFLHH